jgi:hypothetical protein
LRNLRKTVRRKGDRQTGGQGKTEARLGKAGRERTVRRGGFNVPQASGGGGARVADVVSSTDIERTSFPWRRRRVCKRRVRVRTIDTFLSDLLGSALRCRTPIRWVE